MSIVSFKHIATTTLFAQTKFSASANNASYYQGDNTELLYFGAPDIMYEDVCFCKEKGVIYTHGAFYNSGANKGGNFVPQVKNMDSYLAEDGEIVEYVGQTDENYTNGYFYKFRSGIEYTSITIPANKKIVTIYHPDGTQEIGYEIDEELSINSAAWRTSNISSIEPINGGILTNSADWYPYFNSEIAKVGDKIWVKNGNEYIWGEIVGWFWYINLYNYSTSSESINRQIPQSIAESTSKEEATSKILQWLTENGYPQPTIYTVDNIKVKVLLDNGESYYLSSNGAGGYSSINAVTLISPDGKKIFVRTDNVSEQNIYKSTEIRKKGSEYHWYIDPNYNYPTYYTVDTLSESITLKVPVLYEEDGSLKNINSQNLEPSTWQRIDVQPTPNDVVMCKMSDGIVYDSYITYTKIKQYLPDYPYYSDNLNWEIGGNPPMRASITEGDYYLDVDTNHIFVADENIELVDVTSSVVIQGDTNKLYCDTNTNQLYRYDGSNFVALTSEGKTYTLSSNDENIRLTDSDGQIQDLSLNTLINGLSTGNSDPQDDDFIVAQYAGGGTTTTTYHRRPLIRFWNWIKSKLGIGTNDGTFLRKDGTWATPTDSTKVAKAGDSMSGTLTFTTANAINYNANNGNINMIRFKTGDGDGHGIIIGGGGLTVIGAGESATTVAAQTSSGGSETMQVSSDGNIEFYTNCQSGFSSAKKSYLDTSGDLHVNRYVFATHYNQSSADQSSMATSSSYIMFANSDGYLRKATVAQIQSLINTWRPLGTTATTACAGNDSRLSNSRPASDVYAWAKASTKPSYTASEVGAQSATALTASKTHTASSCSVTCYKYGRVVTAHITLYGNGTIYIDTAYKPASTVYFFLLNSDSSSSGIFTNTNTFIGSISTSGFVQGKYVRNNNTSYYGTVTYISAS